MGSAICQPRDEVVAISKTIDNELKKDKIEQLRRFKILLLGSADSGKSTIVKQMRLLHKEGFTDSELIDAVFQIRANLLECFIAIAEAIQVVGWNVNEDEWTMPENEELKLLTQFSELKILQEFIVKYPAYPTIPDNFQYYYRHLDRILREKYVPTTVDVIHTRVPTMGVHELGFDYKSHIVRLIDVGGQRTERRKWIHFFEGVSAVMFVASLSSFDQVLDEDLRKPPTPLAARRQLPRLATLNSTMSHVGTLSSIDSLAPLEKKPVLTNRLQDSIDLFHSVVKNKYLSKSSFILFLNKTDLLEEKLKHTRLHDHFADYVGANDFDSAADYIQIRFRKAPMPENTQLYVHKTQATDTKNIDFVFGAAFDIVIKANLNEVEL